MRDRQDIMTDAAKCDTETKWQNGAFEVVPKNGINLLLLEVLLDIRDKLEEIYMEV